MYSTHKISYTNSYRKRYHIVITIRGDVMEDIQKAYEQLGLEPFADKEEVEKRYSTLLRKYRARSKQGSEYTNDSELEFQKITESYKAILDYETKKYTEAFEEKEYGKYKKMAGQAKKVDHFWRYYKVHTLIAVVLIIGLIYGVIAYMDKQEEKRYLASLPPIDLQISFFGDYYDTTKDDKFETTNNKLLADFPQFQRFDTNMIYLPEDESMRYTYLQKAFVMLMTEKPDIYILDEGAMNYAAPQGLFASLEDVASLAQLKDTKYAIRSAVSNKDEIGPELIYAIDLTESELAKDLPIAHRELYVAIRADAQHPEAALTFIETYAATLPQ